MRTLPVGVATAFLDDEDQNYLHNWSWSLGTKGGAKTNICDSNGIWHPKYMHQFLLYAPPGLMVDHIDGNPLNTHGQNRTNSGPNRNNTLECKGIYPRPNGKFQVQLYKDGKLHTVGTFYSLEKAITAYNDAVVGIHGKHGRFNGVPENTFQELL